MYSIQPVFIQNICCGGRTPRDIALDASEEYLLCANQDSNNITLLKSEQETVLPSVIREFFDITKDSKDIFDGLAIMDTQYAVQINTKPVVFLSFKDCSAKNPEELIRKAWLWSKNKTGSE